MPHARFNAQLAVQDDVLYIYGGTYEKGDREFTFDEMYAVDLGKLDGVKEVFRREPEDWQGSEDEDSDDEDDEDDEDDDDDEENEGVALAPESIASLKLDDSTSASSPSSPTTANASEIDTDDAPSTSALTDNLPHPRPFETLRDFFTRTGNAWQQLLLDELAYVYAPEHKSVKELRKTAFDRAEAKWWDCREEIRVLEDEAEEAGIGEVVSLEDRDKGAGGAGRRR